MKTKTTIIIFMLFLSMFSLFAQTTDYYYYKGHKEFLLYDYNRIGLVIDRNDATALQFMVSSIPFTLTNIPQTVRNPVYDFKLLKFSRTPDNATYNKFISDLKSMSGVQMIQPCFLTLNNRKEVMMSEYLYVKLKNPLDVNMLRSYANSYFLEVVGNNKYMPLWYTLKCTKNTRYDCLTTANQLYMLGRFAAVTPDFLSDDLFCSDDPQFENQWALKNSTNSGIDVSACDAWINATGKGVKVAIVDQGVELTHNDLKKNIYSLSYDSETGTSPSKVYGDHATHCAGIVGAVKDNNLQIAGIAPDAKLISVSNTLYATADSRIKRADAINWAWKNGADIISNSWGSSVKFEAIDDAIYNALTQGRNGKGCIVCFAAGNDNGAVSYPANCNPNILVVGAITSTGKRAIYSNYGNALDVVAPGSYILSTILNNAIDYKDGTSMACPYVAGIAALLLEKNPNLTAKEANDLIERNTKKIGGYSYQSSATYKNGTWNNEMGYGLVDAALVTSHTKPYDLMIRDSEVDTGAEPNLVTEYMWGSCDIWTRNEDDGGSEHENPICKSTPAWIYVRVKNIGTVPTTGDDFVEIRWAKAGLGLSWPASWYEGDRYNDLDIPMGGRVATKVIKVLQPGEETIVKASWDVLDPNVYKNITSEPWHFCLLARVCSTDDPTPEVTYTDLNRYVREHNNIAWKNLTVVEMPSVGQQVGGGVVMVKNRTDIPKNYTIELIDDNLRFTPISYTSVDNSVKPEVNIELSPNLYNAWVEGGSVRQAFANTSSPRVQSMQGNTSILQNIRLQPQEAGIVNVKFSIPSTGVYLFNYTYQVVLKDENGNIVGGETYIVKRNQLRPIIPPSIKQIPNIEAGKVELKASDIDEPASYNWYSENGNLLSTGQELEVTVEKTEKYKLEVVAEKDNYKCYAEAIVKPVEGIVSLSPNPTFEKVTIKFLIHDYNNSVIKISNIEGVGETHEYPISQRECLKVIDVSRFVSGIYTVTLVSNGNFIDSKKLMKN